MRDHRDERMSAFETASFQLERPTLGGAARQRGAGRPTRRHSAVVMRFPTSDIRSSPRDLILANDRPSGMS